MSCFRPSCGEELGEHNRYCIRSGSQRKTPRQSQPDNIKRTKTHDDFIQEKGKERHGFLKQKKIQNSSGTATCTRTSKVKASPNICSEVLINVGLFESNEEGDIFPKRGSRIPVKFGKQYTTEEVLQIALKKHADNDQFFCSLDDYVLCYPDQKIVEFIPGTTESFTVEKCKEEFLSKPHSEMDLFLCNISVYGNCSNMKNSKSNTNSNQSEKKVENNILDNNSHAFEPGIPNSLGLSPGDFLSSCSSFTTCLPNF